MFTDLIKKLPSPILVLGASGFIGANFFHALYKERKDVYATASRWPAWRLKDIPVSQVEVINLLDTQSLKSFLYRVKPKIIFNFVAYGAYSFEEDFFKIYQTNFLMLLTLLEYCKENDVNFFLNSGSSSEYGLNCSAPLEESYAIPNSHYAVSKISSSEMIKFYGKIHNVNVINVRLYSVFGPMEDSSRLVPRSLRAGLLGDYPPLANPETSRDFIYIDDVIDFYLRAAIFTPKNVMGESFNLGTGKKTTLREFSNVLKKIFQLKNDAVFENYQSRKWDLGQWYANIEKIKKYYHWEPKYSLKLGLEKSIEWLKTIENHDEYEKNSKLYLTPENYSLSFIVPTSDLLKGDILLDIYLKLKKISDHLGIDYEVIFISDILNESTILVIKDLSQSYTNIKGVILSRNFGDQPSYLAGMEIMSKKGSVLIPSKYVGNIDLIFDFFKEWKNGYSIIYGIESRSFLLHQFDSFIGYFTNLKIPLFSSDYCLLDRRICTQILACNEHLIFIKGLRAFVGFKQKSVTFSYVKSPYFDRKSGFKILLDKFDLYKSGIITVSNFPIHLITFFGIALFVLSLFYSFIHILMKYFNPNFAPEGLTTVMLAITFFGSINIFAISIIGQYISSILTESKKRPKYIHSQCISQGKIY